MDRPVTSRRVICLVFGSGLCALVYQTVWLREFRLIFGSTTAATAVVVGIFMAGLGVGGAILGPMCDGSSRPLRLYAALEAGITMSAALSPLLIGLAGHAYVALGGTLSLGMAMGTTVRVVLSVLVLAVPTFLMGGTLPAAARAVESAEDHGRLRIALLYGANTLGAVLGCGLATFYLLEHWGNEIALWSACALNGCIALSGFVMSRTVTTVPSPETEDTEAPSAAPAILYGMAALTGFSFFLMEMVWYRMLTPLLGGTVFTFGLILMTALLGVGLGGAAYAAFGERPSMQRFALTCSAEALFLAIPFALGDRLATFELLLRSLRSLGFGGLVYAWSLVTMVIVLPASCVAGYQFPLLIAMLGRGRSRAGSHTGRAYACNTMGSLAGSLAGGFGLLPLLQATGTWRLVVALLALLGLMASGVGRRPGMRSVAPVLALCSICMLLATGPTAFWRQNPIGAGRATFTCANRNDICLLARDLRRNSVWQADGREACVGLQMTETGYAFVVNGKVDGNARGDAGTQVMSGMIAAWLHPPRTCLVVGCGTGSTAGWLADVPTLEVLDLFELEPVVLRVADACAAVNHGMRTNPKIRIHIADGREALLTAPRKYDLIVSEPSNPYRAGVATLFTRECYTAASHKLAPHGLFCQWMQTYEVSTETIRTFYGTFASVFPYVETWSADGADLVLIGSMEPIHYDVAELRARMHQPPFNEAMMQIWRVDDLEGVLGFYLGGSGLAAEIGRGAQLNTDDRNLLEFGFARTVGETTGLQLPQLQSWARQLRVNRPATVGGAVDWEAVEDRRQSARPQLDSHLSAEQTLRTLAKVSWCDNKLTDGLAYWRQQKGRPQGPMEVLMLADMLANAADETALPYLRQLQPAFPVESAALLGVLRWRQKRPAEATAAMEEAFTVWRHNSWPNLPVMLRAINTVQEMAVEHAELAPRLARSLEEPWPAAALDEVRRVTQMQVARSVDPDSAVRILNTFGSDYPWTLDFLQQRAEILRAAGDPRQAEAQADLKRYLELP